MEYEHCEGSREIITPVAILAFALVLLLIYFFFLGGKERFTDRTDEIIAALDVTMKQNGTIVDFKNSINDPKFSPLKYIHLADLYRQGKADRAAVEKVLSDPNL
jgi:hypothetical protein